MNYQVIYKNKQFGFSIIEVIVVLGIFALLFTVSTSVYNSFQSHQNLEIGATSVVQAARYSQSNAQMVKDDSSWGVKVLVGSVIVFKGATYVSRDQSKDQALALPTGVIPTGLSEVVFAKLTGSTSNVGAIVLTNSYGVKNIDINAKGTITY